MWRLINIKVEEGFLAVLFQIVLDETVMTATNFSLAAYSVHTSLLRVAD